MHNTKRYLATIGAATLTLLLVVSAYAAPHEGNPGGNCDGFNGPNKVDTTDGSIVLPAGTLVCIKAGNSNTGTLEADGVSTLADLIKESGLRNKGGKIPDVSNYVTYPPTPTPTPTATPKPEPSPTIIPEPTPEPQRPAPTPPPTDTE